MLRSLCLSCTWTPCALQHHFCQQLSVLHTGERGLAAACNTDTASLANLNGLAAACSTHTAVSTASSDWLCSPAVLLPAMA